LDRLARNLELRMKKRKINEATPSRLKSEKTKGFMSYRNKGEIICVGSLEVVKKK